MNHSCSNFCVFVRLFLSVKRIYCTSWAGNGGLPNTMDTWTEHHRTLLTSQLQILMFGNNEQQWHVYKRTCLWRLQSLLIVKPSNFPLQPMILQCNTLLEVHLAEKPWKLPSGNSMDSLNYTRALQAFNKTSYIGFIYNLVNAHR